MTFCELKKLFQAHESCRPATHLTAYITFSSFGASSRENFDWNARTYAVSSDNKAFRPDMCGYSIFGSCLNGTDVGVRLDRYMKEEHGGENGWIIEECCVAGFLLVHYSCETQFPPAMYYSVGEAREKMLSQMAELGDLSLTQLKMDYERNGFDVTTEGYYANKLGASLSAEGEDWFWEIKPAFIYGPLRIEFSNG